MSTSRQGQRFTQSEQQEAADETLATYLAPELPANITFKVNLRLPSSITACMMYVFAPSLSEFLCFHPLRMEIIPIPSP